MFESIDSVRREQVTHLLYIHIYNSVKKFHSHNDLNTYTVDIYTENAKQKKRIRPTIQFDNGNERKQFPILSSHVCSHARVSCLHHRRLTLRQPNCVSSSRCVAMYFVFAKSRIILTLRSSPLSVAPRVKALHLSRASRLPRCALLNTSLSLSASLLSLSLSRKISNCDATRRAACKKEVIYRDLTNKLSSIHFGDVCDALNRRLYAFHSTCGDINYAGGKSARVYSVYNERTCVRFARKWRPR